MSALDVRLARRPDVDARLEGSGAGAERTSRPLLAISGMATLAVVAMLFVGAWLTGAPARGEPTAVTADPARTIDAYAGLGVWVDVFDFAPEYQAAGEEPAIRPAHVATMAAQGASTLYIQAARNDRSAADGLVAPDLLGAFLRAAHDAGLRVVAFYSPGFLDPAADIQRIQAMHSFDDAGQRFDGLALDIEETGAVADPTERTQALLQISDAAREVAGTDALGAIVMPPVLLEDINPGFWPRFPWAELAERYDVFLPMSYWTFRTEGSGWRDAARYTRANVERVRALVGSDTPIHVIGGVGADASDSDYPAFVAAIRDVAPFGASVFDFRSTPTAGWLQLQSLTESGGVFAPVGGGA